MIIYIQVYRSLTVCPRAPASGGDIQRVGKDGEGMAAMRRPQSHLFCQSNPTKTDDRRGDRLFFQILGVKLQPNMTRPNAQYQSKRNQPSVSPDVHQPRFRSSAGYQGLWECKARAGNYILCSHRIISCLSPTLLDKKDVSRPRGSDQVGRITRLPRFNRTLKDFRSEALFSRADVGVLSSETPLSEKMLDFKRLVLRSPGGRAVPEWDTALFERLRLGHLTILLRRQGPRFPGPVAVVCGS